MKRILDITPSTGPAYPVLCGASPAEALKELWQDRWHRSVIIADETTDHLFAGEVEAALHELGTSPLRLSFAAGESSKTRAGKVVLEDAMLHAGIDRSSCVVAVGGGIPLDIAGFVAATYMRGIAHINIATTLLAQVDAAVGGKTAINTDQGKNLIGAFHHPRAVLLHTEALEQLPDVELRNGLAEAVKHAVLQDANLFDEFEKWASQRQSLCPPDEFIARCVEIKAAVVAKDDRDLGMRNILNFGHTAAHAIELASDHATPHGHAVAIGMVIECRLATNAGVFPSSHLDRLRMLLHSLGLPTETNCRFEQVKPFFTRDKKTEADTIYCAIPTALGEYQAQGDGPGGWTRSVTLNELEQAWKESSCSA